MNELFREGTKPIENGVRTRFTEIIVESGYLVKIPEVLQRRASGKRYAVITDSTVAGLYGRGLKESLRGVGLEAELFDFPEGERSKNLETVRDLKHRLETSGYEGESIIALGGGVVGDVAGYVAYESGKIPYIQVPTTLSAQVDSCYGGKVGVNTVEGKNLVRRFHHPMLILVDPETTLKQSERGYRNGFGELTKHAIIDLQFGQDLMHHSDSLLKRDIEQLSRFILESLTIKAFYVGKDPFDKGPRQVLNFGHTIGHGIEHASIDVNGNYGWLHGESISPGMVVEDDIPTPTNRLPREKSHLLVELLEIFGLPTKIPDDMDREKIIEAVMRDKKRDDDNIKFVIPSQSDPLHPIQIKMSKDEVRRLIS